MNALANHARAGALLLAVACCAAGAVATEDQPVGYLRFAVYAPAPLTPEAGGTVTVHMRNVSQSPVRFMLDSLGYQPSFVFMSAPGAGADPAKVYDAWGPPVGEFMHFDRSGIRVSGVGRPGQANWVPEWPAREGITLLNGEGYARFMTFAPGWIAAAAVPRSVRDCVVFDAAPPASVALPLLQPGAVAPGQPIRWAAPHRVMLLGSVLVPFHRGGTRPASTPVAAGVQDGASDAPAALRALVELPASIPAGQDLVATYLIGNSGGKPLWLWQNSLVPALTTWVVRKGDKVLATVDGGGLAGLVDLLPERAPLLLNPGEYLSFQRTLLAGALPWTRGSTYQVQAAFTAQWLDKAPTADDKSRTLPLSAAAAIAVR